jgi:hypothetical protein
MKEFIRKLRIKFALNMSRSKSEKNITARHHADEAKTFLHTHKKRKPTHHKKVAVKRS